MDHAPEGSAPKRRTRVQGLMHHRVRNILLVSSLYDSFILAEDGQLQKAILHEFIELNLSNNPTITWAPDGAEALSLIRGGDPIDLIISTLPMGGWDVPTFAREVRALAGPIPVVVLAYHHRELRSFQSRGDLSCVDQVFLWQGDVRILLAIVKHVEDRLNAAHDVGLMGVPAILAVEDNVRYYSAFLPAIYTELVGHSQHVISEAVNLSDKVMRMRARPKVLLAVDFEQAVEWFDAYPHQLLGVISDVEFSWKGAIHPRAGVELARHMRLRRPDLPLALQSSIPANERLAQEVGASFLLKGSPNLVQQLRRLITDEFGLGPFSFRTAEGVTVGRARDLRSMVRVLRQVPADSLLFHGRAHRFSAWASARGEFDLARELRDQQVDDFEDGEALREHLIQLFSEHRRVRAATVVADYDRYRPDRASRLARVSGGSLGGKARGLAFANRLLVEYGASAQFPSVNLSVPEAVVLGTDCLESFLDSDDLRTVALSSGSDEEIWGRFLDAPFPEEVRRDLAAYLRGSTHPLAVRSSSLLEDSPNQPMAGIYETFMLANGSGRAEDRLLALLQGVKRVYASMFASKAKEFFGVTPYRLEEERMAVIVQRLVGRHHGPRFYPDFSGVARSHNHYPVGPQRSEDGIAAVALGFGKTVVEGRRCVRFSPRHPEVLIEFSSTEGALENSQRDFYGLAVGVADAPGAACLGITDLKAYELEVAERDGVLGPLGSTYDAESRVVVDGLSRPGVRLVTFAGVLKHRMFPLPEILDFLLRIGADACGGPVEIEFAVNLEGTETDPRPEFGFLQMRPVGAGGESESVDLGSLDQDGLEVCSSEAALGNGRWTGLGDLILVDREGFDRTRSPEVAAAVARLNAQLLKQQRPYVLVGVGRWGSADPLLGIPVSWSQISGARVIVEASFEDLDVVPSQGTHFFQNLISCGVGYLAINPLGGRGYLDWDWLRSLPQGGETGHPLVTHRVLPEGVLVAIDGRIGRGVMVGPTPG